MLCICSVWSRSLFLVMLSYCSWLVKEYQLQFQVSNFPAYGSLATLLFRLLQSCLSLAATFLMQQLRRVSLSPQLETGPASEVKMSALWVRRCMARAALEALEGTGRLSKVCVLTGSDWRGSEVWMSILHNCRGTISCMEMCQPAWVDNERLLIVVTCGAGISF